MPDYLFVLVVTIVMGLLPYIIGGLFSFFYWENAFKGVSHWHLFRCCILMAVIGCALGTSLIYLK